MVQSVKATYEDGVLKPSESLDLEDGDEVTLSISVEGGGEDGEVSASESVGGNRADNGADVESASHKGTDIPALLERFRKIRESVPESAWENVPKDGSINYKHYLYGHPKVDEE
ncbi:MAG: antitoxin family protein [Chloroflexi bacterium]|nr:antitoxin family protein [Chloroflexota bacterium]